MRQKFNSIKNRIKAGAIAASVALVSAPAFASGGTGVDTSSIEAVFDEYKGIAVGLLIAYIVVRWTLKATGLLQPKG